MVLRGRICTVSIWNDTDFSLFKQIYGQKVCLFGKKSYLCMQQNPPRFPKTSEPGRGVLYIYVMRYSKQPISITEQIDILKRRGLVFDNEQEAISVLENISYFRLAGYWRTMEQDSYTKT